MIPTSRSAILAGSTCPARAPSHPQVVPAPSHPRVVITPSHPQVVPAPSHPQVVITPSHPQVVITPSYPQVVTAPSHPQGVITPSHQQVIPVSGRSSQSLTPTGRPSPCTPTGRPSPLHRHIVPVNAHPQVVIAPLHPQVVIAPLHPQVVPVSAYPQVGRHNPFIPTGRHNPFTPTGRHSPFTPTGRPSPLLPQVVPVHADPQVDRSVLTTSPTTCLSWLYISPFVTSPVSHYTPTGRQCCSDNVPNNLSFLALYLSLCYLPCQSLHTHRSSERLRQRPQQLVVPGFMSLPLLPPLSVTSHPQVVRAAPTTSPTTGRSWLYGSPFVTSPVSHFTPTGRQSGSDNVPNNWSFLALWLSLCYLPCQSLHTHRSSERLRQRPQQLVVPGFMSAPLSPRTVGVALWRKWAGVIDPRTVPHPRLHPRRV